VAPQAHALRFTVVAYASPRWRAASGAADADRRNEKLAEERERNVLVIVERILRQTLGPTVPIHGGTSHAQGAVPQGVEVGGYSVGSRDSLRATHGDRQNNDEAYRKVDVRFERFTATTYTGMRSAGQVSTRIRKWWAVRIDQLHVTYSGGNATGDADLTLINGDSMKSMRAKVHLDGSGYNVGITPSPNPGKMLSSLFRSVARTRSDSYRDKPKTDHSFGCNREMGFADFNGQTVTFKKSTYTVGVKGSTMSLTFDNLGSDASELMLTPMGGIGLIGLGHYAVSGRLHLVGPNPGDWMDQDPQVVSNVATKHDGFTLTLTFPTGKSRYEDIGIVDRMKFESLVEGHAARFAQQLAKKKDN